MSNTITRSISQAFSQRPIVYLPIYRHITGSTTAGILLSQLSYWQSAMNEREFYKTDQEIMNETALSEKELKNAKRRLKNLPFLEISRKGVPCRTFYRLDGIALDEYIRNFQKEQGQTVWAERAEPVRPKGPNCMGRKGRTITDKKQDKNTDTPLVFPQGKTKKEKEPSQANEKLVTVNSPPEQTAGCPDVNKVSSNNESEAMKKVKLKIGLKQYGHLKTMIAEGDFDGQPSEKKKVLLDFLEYRREIKKPIPTVKGIRRTWNKFKSVEVEDCQEAFAETEANGYTGIFPKKKIRKDRETVTVKTPKYFTAEDYEQQIQGYASR